MKTLLITLSFFITVIIPDMTFTIDGKIKDSKEEIKTDSIIYKFQFPYSGEKPWTAYNDYSKRDEKIFGKSIAQLFCLIDHSYIVYSNSENDYHPNIIKPSIYNSLIRLKQYYKNIFKKNQENNLQLKSELEIFLIKGYLCYYEETQEIEKMLKEAETIADIIKILNSIKLTS